MKRSASQKVQLITKSREATLAAVQLFNNPLASFKTESFIVLSMIAWTYMLHAYYRAKGVENRYFEQGPVRRRFVRNSDNSYRYWDLTECIKSEHCPLDSNTSNNLLFLIGLRNQIEHNRPEGLDSYLSARYQACMLNFNFYIKKLHGEKYGLDDNLTLSLQFGELTYNQANVIKNKEKLIPAGINSYIASFDSKLSENERNNERYAYRLLFTKTSAKREGQADRVVEFLDPNSELAKNIDKEYWVKEEREKPKFRPTDVVREVQKAGFRAFNITKHTDMWKAHDAKSLAKGYGVEVAKTWYWYQNWVDLVIQELSEAGRTQI